VVLCLPTFALKMNRPNCGLFDRLSLSLLSLARILERGLYHHHNFHPVLRFSQLSDGMAAPKYADRRSLQTRYVFGAGLKPIL